MVIKVKNIAQASHARRFVAWLSAWVEFGIVTPDRRGEAISWGNSRSRQFLIKRLPSARGAPSKKRAHAGRISVYNGLPESGFTRRKGSPERKGRSDAP